MSNFVIVFITPPLFDIISGGYYFVLLGFCVISGIVVYFVYPETAHVTLEQLSQIFGDTALDSEKLGPLTPLQLTLERIRSTMVPDNSSTDKLLHQPKSISGGVWTSSSTTLGGSTLDTPANVDPDLAGKRDV
jgi:hypothetical protein